MERFVIIHTLHSADDERKESKKNTPKKKPRRSPSGKMSPTEHVDPVVHVKSEADQPTVNKPAVKFREKKPAVPSQASQENFQAFFHRKSTMLSPVKKASNRSGVPRFLSACHNCLSI